MYINMIDVDKNMDSLPPLEVELLRLLPEHVVLIKNAGNKVSLFRISSNARDAVLRKNPETGDFYCKSVC